MSEATMDKTSGETTKKTTNEMQKQVEMEMKERMSRTMSENEKETKRFLSESHENNEMNHLKSRIKYKTDFNYRHTYIPYVIIKYAIMNLCWIIGIYFAFFHAKWQTWLWVIVLILGGSQGVGLGAHRGFSHTSFKMKPPLEVLLLFLFSTTGQGSMLNWVKNHRLHHKYSETDADPHNASRGFFFSHLGWLMTENHPLLIEKREMIDVSDMLSNPYVRFQAKYETPLYLAFSVLMPTIVPIYYWNETFWTSFFVSFFFRIMTFLHLTLCGNSVCHLWGNRPYDKRIQAVQSMLTTFLTLGEGLHNFHHTFPFDSRQSEYGKVGGLNTIMLDIFSYLGLAYDTKIASIDVVYKHMKRHGDETAAKVIAKYFPARFHTKIQEIVVPS